MNLPISSSATAKTSPSPMNRLKRQLTNKAVFKEKGAASPRNSLASAAVSARSHGAWAHPGGSRVVLFSVSFFPFFWPFWRRWSGAPCHATPRHATPRRATPRST